MKPILPTLKEEKRYILFETIPKASYQSTVESINASCFNLMGSLDSARAGIQIFNSAISVNRKYVDHVRAALATIKAIDNKQVIVKSIKTSSTINRLKKIKK